MWENLRSGQLKLNPPSPFFSFLLKIENWENEREVHLEDSRGVTAGKILIKKKEKANFPEMDPEMEASHVHQRWHYTTFLIPTCNIKFF